LEFLNSQQKFVVIPAKLAIPPEADQPQAEASASRNPGNTRKTGLPPFDAAQDMLSR